MTGSRRRFLAAAAGAAAVALAGPAAADPLARLVARAARSPQLASRGRAFRAMHPALARSDLLAALARRLPEPAAPDHRLVAQLRTAAGADFRAGRTLRLDGWLVSETEALICAAAIA